MSLERKILYGLSDIYVSKLTNGTYATPVKIDGAKNVQATLSYESSSFYADNREVAVINGFAGGEGTLGVLSLSASEYNLLFGHTKIGEDGYLVKSTDQAPTLALGFARERLDGTRQGYWLYNVKFKPTSISATTMEEGKVEEDAIELEFSISERADRKVYYVQTANETFFDSVPVNPVAPVSAVEGK